MIQQKFCPLCDWEIDWGQVKKAGELDLCPMCNTRLVGEVKICDKCGMESPVDAFYCLHCKNGFSVDSVPGFLEMINNK